MGHREQKLNVLFTCKAESNPQRYATRIMIVQYYWYLLNRHGFNFHVLLISHTDIYAMCSVHVHVYAYRVPAIIIRVVGKLKTRTMCTAFITALGLRKLMTAGKGYRKTQESLERKEYCTCACYYCFIMRVLCGAGCCVVRQDKTTRRRTGSKREL